MENIIFQKTTTNTPYESTGDANDRVNFGVRMTFFFVIDEQTKLVVGMAWLFRCAQILSPAIVHDGAYLCKWL